MGLSLIFQNPPLDGSRPFVSALGPLGKNMQKQQSTTHTLVKLRKVTKSHPWNSLRKIIAPANLSTGCQVELGYSPYVFVYFLGGESHKTNGWNASKAWCGHDSASLDLSISTVYIYSSAMLSLFWIPILDVLQHICIYSIYRYTINSEWNWRAGITISWRAAIMAKKHHMVQQHPINQEIWDTVPQIFWNLQGI